MSLETELKKIGGSLERIANALETLTSNHVAHPATTEIPAVIDTAPDAPVTPAAQDQVILPADMPDEKPLTTDELTGLNNWLGDIANWLNGMGLPGEDRIRAAIASCGLQGLHEIGNSRTKLDEVVRAVQAVIAECQNGQVAA